MACKAYSGPVWPWSPALGLVIDDVAVPIQALMQDCRVVFDGHPVACRSAVH